MSIKPAQEAFHRDEILDILNRNVQLYRDEVGFSSYFVDLTMFLLDQHYEKGRISPWEAPEPPSSNRKPSPATTFSGVEQVKMPPTIAELQNRGQHGPEISERQPIAYQPPSAVSPRTPLPVSSPSERGSSSSARIRISGIFPAASPNAGRQEVDIDPQSGRLRVSNENNAVPPAGGGPSGLSSRFEVEASPLSTPAGPATRQRNKIVSHDLNLEPPDAEIDPPSSQRRTGAVRKNEYGEIEPPAIKQGDPQKTPLRRSNFQMYRTAKSQSNVDVPCPSCGLRVSINVKQCPGCGHFL